MSGCATTSSVTDSSEANNRVNSVAVSDKSKSVPNVALDKELLENLLVDRFAVYSSQWDESLKSSLLAANKTEDWRLAKRAAEIGFTLAKDYTLANEAAALWLKLKPEDIDAKLNYFASAVAIGKYADVIGMANEFVKQHPKGQHDALMILSQYLRTQPNEGAVQLMSNMESSFSDSADFMYEATIISAWFKEDKLAREYLQKALQIESDHERANIFQYQLISIEQGVPEANLYLRNQIERFPNSSKLRNQHLGHLYNERQFTELIEITDTLQSLSKGSIDDAAAWYFRGASLVQLDRLTEAEDALNKVLQINPKDNDTRLQLGRIYYANKQYEKSIKVLNEIDSGANTFDAGIVVARALAREYEGDVGVNRALRKLNGLPANTKQRIVDRAMAQSGILSNAKQPLRAMGFLNDALAAYPDDQELLYARGLIASEAGELAVAEADLRKLIDIQPLNATALNALGYTLVEQTTRYNEAEALIQRALAIEPTSHYILDSAGWVAYKKGDLVGAIEYLRQAYAVEQNPEIAAHLGEVLYKSGDQDAARQIWLQSQQVNPGNSTLLETINKFR